MWSADTSNTALQALLEVSDVNGNHQQKGHPCSAFCEGVPVRGARLQGLLSEFSSGDFSLACNPSATASFR